jgi:hypothetical protein
MMNMSAFPNSSRWLKQQVPNRAQQAVGNGLHFIKHNPFLGSMFTEVVGCNIPKVFMVGSEKERHEQFIMQFLNTTVIWGGGFVYDKVLERGIYAQSSHYKPMMEGKAPTPQALKDARYWHALGKTSGMFGLIVPWMFTLPFLRNAFTVWNTGATNFAQMSGMQSYNRDDPKHQEAERKALQKNLGVFATMNIAGLGLGLAGALAARRGMDASMKGETVAGALGTFRRLSENFDKSFKGLPLIGSKDPKESALFKDGKFTNFDGLPLVVSWILPGYAGYLFSMRDPVEACENVVNTAIALFSFEAGPSALRKGIERYMNNHPEKQWVRGAQKHLGSIENTGTLSKMLISTSLYGMLPSALALITRPLRARMAGMKDDPRQPKTSAACAAVQPEPMMSHGTYFPSPRREERQPDVTRDPIPLPI